MHKTSVERETHLKTTINAPKEKFTLFCVCLFGMHRRAFNTIRLGCAAFCSLGSQASFVGRRFKCLSHNHNAIENDEVYLSDKRVAFDTAQRVECRTPLGRGDKDEGMNGMKDEKLFARNDIEKHKQL